MEGQRREMARMESVLSTSGHLRNSTYVQWIQHLHTPVKITGFCDVEKKKKEEKKKKPI